MTLRRPRELSRDVELFAARTPTLPPATHTNTYALGERQVLLVEPATPYEDEQRAWLDWARSLPSSGREAVAVVLTHHHADHVGGAATFARALGLPVWAHEETARRIDVPVGRRLTDGEVLELEGPTPARWRVLHTPGHAPGHVCLFSEQTGTLVAGDMVASVGTILIAPGDGDMRVYLEQLERLAALEPRLALPAHGEPIDDPVALLRGYVAHRLRREARVLGAIAARGAQGSTSEEALSEAYGDVPVGIWPVALLSLEAHLIKLVSDGRVEARDSTGERTRYTARS